MTFENEIRVVKEIQKQFFEALKKVQFSIKSQVCIEDNSVKELELINKVETLYTILRILENLGEGKLILILNKVLIQEEDDGWWMTNDLKTTAQAIIKGVGG